LCTKNLHIRKGSSKKLLPRYIGLPNIAEKVNPVAFKLDLPNRLRMHNGFHISLLRVYIEGKHPRSPEIPECVEGEYEYTVERIVQHKYVQSGKNKQVLEYLVMWKGYSSVNDSWEPSARLSNYPEIVKQYNKGKELPDKVISKTYKYFMDKKTEK
jgi:hypothetical protein